MNKRIALSAAFFFSLLAALSLSPDAALAQDQDSSEGEEASGENMENPYAGQAEIAAEGKELYNQFNCYACHGRAGGGGMGPSLTDGQWRYGSEAHNIFTTIKDGRPAGMPSFEAALDEDQIWKIVTFVQSLSSNGESTSSGSSD